MLVPGISEHEVRELTWDHCGIVRDRAGLTTAIARLDRTEWETTHTPTLAAIELRNMHQVAALIARCGLWREESRGAHYRSDFPEKHAEFARPSRTSRTLVAARS
jgi:L-aspartate oxidase